MRANIQMRKDVTIILYFFIYLLFIHVWKNLRRVKRKRWMKKREQYSHVLLLNEIRDTEPGHYKNYFRMNDITFDNLLKLVLYFREVVFFGEF